VVKSVDKEILEILKGIQIDIKKDVSTVEIVTAINYADIAKLIAVK
jgi:hypothetical protein